MSKRLTLWLIPAMLYMFFVLWYTDFGGPLSDEEIDVFMSTMVENDADPQVTAFIETFAREDSGRQFLMVNNLDMNDDAPDVEGAAPGENAEHHFKTAALTKTIAYPIETSLYLSDLRLLLALFLLALTGLLEAFWLSGRGSHNPRGVKA